jgi:hypothetical protein
MRTSLLLIAAAMILTCTPAIAQSEAPQRTQASARHISAAENTMRAAYAVRNATNGCPTLTADMHGWPAARVRHCIYEEEDRGLGHPRVAVAYLLNVDAPTLARWIETACALVATDGERCFTRVLHAGRMNSGYQFPIAGNMLEDMEDDGSLKNYFFRNGMTASFRAGVNGNGAELTLEDQEALAATASESVLSVPTGLTRYWRTRPADFAARFPDSGAPPNTAGAENRAAWLALAQTEMLAALDSDRNRLLEAWLCANATELFGATCAAS